MHVTVDPARIPYVDALPRIPAAAVTIAVAVPASVPFVALTVLLNVPATAPAVKVAVSPVVPAGMVPPPFTTDQVTVPVIGTGLLAASLPDAVYTSEVLTGIVPGFGVTTIDASGPAVTMAVAVPASVPFVALTVLVNVPGTEPAVKVAVSPVVPAGMVPPPLTTDHVTVPVIGTGLLNASLPDAVYTSGVLMGIVPGFGVTTIDASGPATMVTVAVPTTPLHVTLTVNVPGVVPAVNRPVLALMVPPPETDQVSPSILTAFPSVSVPATVNACVPFGWSVTEAGVTVRVSSL
jgi:hypothetical protein